MEVAPAQLADEGVSAGATAGALGDLQRGQTPEPQVGREPRGRVVGEVVPAPVGAETTVQPRVEAAPPGRLAALGEVGRTRPSDNLADVRHATGLDLGTVDSRGQREHRPSRLRLPAVPIRRESGEGVTSARRRELAGGNHRDPGQAADLDAGIAETPFAPTRVRAHVLGEKEHVGADLNRRASDLRSHVAAPRDK